MTAARHSPNSPWRKTYKSNKRAAVVFNVRLDADIYTSLDDYCTAHNISKRHLIEQSIMQFIANKNSD